MKSFTIEARDAGCRFNKYLNKLMPEAGSGFLYKMLRKKNITLNGAKAEGNEVLSRGDVVEIFFSDETFSKFRGEVAKEVPTFSKHKLSKKQIVFENEHLIVAYKPAGLLSQKDTEDSESINELLLTYLADKGELTAESLRSFKPGICNRLDRNTPGILFFAKTAASGREINRLLKERRIRKYYYAVVNGIMTEFIDSKLYLTKDTEGNQVRITEGPISSDSVPVHTDFTPLKHNTDLTLVRVCLHTGKSHQIRSVLQYLGHPILGDPKYIAEGDRYHMRNTYYRNTYHLHGQQLLAYCYLLPKEVGEPLSDLSCRVFRSPVPEDFAELLMKEFDAKGDCHAVLEIPGTKRLPVRGTDQRNE